MDDAMKKFLLSHSTTWVTQLLLRYSSSTLSSRNPDARSEDLYVDSFPDPKVKENKVNLEDFWVIELSWQLNSWRLCITIFPFDQNWTQVCKTKSFRSIGHVVYVQLGLIQNPYNQYHYIIIRKLLLRTSSPADKISGRFWRWIKNRRRQIRWYDLNNF